MQSYAVLQGSASFPLVFLLVSSSDHISPLAGATATVTISKNGGAFAAPAGAVTEIANGWYKVAGNGTDTGTLGPLLLHATATGADPTDCLYPVVAFNPQSASNLGLSNLDAAVSSRSTYAGGDTAGTTTLLARLTATRATNLDNLDAAVSTRLATSGYTVPPTSSVVAAAVWDLATTGHTTSGTFGAAMNAAGSAGDPWATALPGAYGAGTAGNIVGNRLDAAVTSRMATFTLPANFAALAIGTDGHVQIQGSIRKNQALAGFEFSMVLSDHYTPATGKTITARRSIDGGAFAACANAAVEVADGTYRIDLAAADLNGNTVTLEFAATGCDTTFITLVTVP